MDWYDQTMAEIEKIDDPELKQACTNMVNARIKWEHDRLARQASHYRHMEMSANDDTVL